MKGRSSVGVLVALLVMGVTAFYAARNPERQDLNDAARKGASGQFVRLSEGVTHYELSGPDSGRVIVLVHGFSVPYYIWDSTAAALSSAGRRVLRYDQFGRGLSDRPHVEYTADVYDRQLGELLDSLHINGPVDVAGVSMGGWVTATFTGRHPKRVRSLILVDPVADTGSRSLGVYGWPVVGPYLWQTLVAPTTADNQASDFLHPDRFPDWAERYRPQTRLRGFGHALLSTRRVEAGLRMDSVYRVVAQTRTPVMLLWGTSDKTVPFARNELVRKALPAAEFHPIDDAAHLPILERAALTDSLFLSFLARQAP
ncbi:MAG TPA: alpha/beta hydrolase [Gemmatimonadaceae bacterium]